MDTLYTRVEAAQYLSVSPAAVRHYMRKDLLPAFKKGKTWLFQETDLKTFKESEWFRTRKPGVSPKYPDDMPRLYLFADKPQKERVKQQNLNS
jgi:excisionase family DNA binding protein